MAQYRVQGPDGQERIIEGPDGASDDEILSQAQQLLGSSGTKKRPIDTFMDIAGRLGQGITDLPVGAVQNLTHMFASGDTAKAVDQKIAEQEATYKNEHPVDGVDFARGFGNAIPMLAAAPAGWMAAAGMGAIDNGMLPVTEGDFFTEKAKQVGSGAIMGPLGYGVGKGVEKALPAITSAVAKGIFPEAAQDTASRMGSTVDQMANAGQPNGIQLAGSAMDDLKQRILANLTSGKQADPSALGRQADFDLLGIPPVKGQLTRDPVEFANERNLRAAFPELTVRFAEQEKGIREHLTRILGEPDPTGSSRANRAIAEGLSRYDSVLRNRISAMYEDARSTAGRHAAIDMGPVSNSFAETMKTFADTVPSVVQKAFANTGQNVFNGAQAKRTANMVDAEDLIRMINANTNEADPVNYRAMGELRNAVKSAIDNSEQGNSPFAIARGEASRRFDLHEQLPVLAEVFGKGVDKMNIDRIANRYLVNGSTREAQLLSQVLRQEPEAWAAAKSQLAEHIHRAALGENPAGDAISKATGLTKALRSIGDEKLQAFFSPEEIDTLHTISRVAGYINSQPAHSAVNHSNSAVVGAQMVGDILKRIPKVNAAVGAASKVGKMVNQQKVVNDALRAEVPTTPFSGLTDEQQALVDLAKRIGAFGPRVGTAGAATYGERR
jgi:hypothetical protein